MVLERCCQQQPLLDASSHTPTEIPPERARYSQAHVGSEYIGWLRFQPVYEDLVQRNPDMFE